MRILCYQHVAEKDVRAFREEDGITVATVRDLLTPDASDAEIVAYAAANDWAVYTNDADFYRYDSTVDLPVYSQVDDPDPGDVVDAIETIDASYPSGVEIIETVPDGWT